VSGPAWRRWLAGSALLAGALAPFVGNPLRGRRASIDVEQLAGLVAREEDHVSAVQLAAWLKEGRPGLRVVDVRSASEFAAFHIPGAESVPLESLAKARFAASDTIVLYSEAGVHGAQAWVFLRALGHRQVFFLRRGLHEWLEDVLGPASPGRAGGGAKPGGVPLARRGRGC
jgi:rhodanese-related sulfurtransferase